MLSQGLGPSHGLKKLTLAPLQTQRHASARSAQRGMFLRVRHSRGRIRIPQFASCAARSALSAKSSSDNPLSVTGRVTRARRCPTKSSDTLDKLVSAVCSSYSTSRGARLSRRYASRSPINRAASSHRHGASLAARTRCSCLTCERSNARSRSAAGGKFLDSWRSSASVKCAAGSDAPSATSGTGESGTGSPPCPRPCRIEARGGAPSTHVTSPRVVEKTNCLRDESNTRRRGKLAPKQRAQGNLNPVACPTAVHALPS